jgi:hypothetical protein
MPTATATAASPKKSLKLMISKNVRSTAATRTRAISRSAILSSPNPAAAVMSSPTEGAKTQSPSVVRAELS